MLVVVALLQRAGLVARAGRSAASTKSVIRSSIMAMQLALGRVEGVVEVEQPGVDVAEVGRRSRSRADQRAGAVLGEQLDQHGVGAAAVQDDHGLDARARPRRWRSPAWGSCRRWRRRRRSGLRASATVIWRISSPFASSTPATSVSSSMRLAFSDAGEGAGHGVGVDVVGLALVGDADRGDHRHIVLRRRRSGASISLGSTRLGSPTKPRSTLVLDRCCRGRAWCAWPSRR